MTICLSLETQCGDLVDYIRNVWTDLSGSPTAGDIWKTVALGDDYKDRYKNFID